MSLHGRFVWYEFLTWNPENTGEFFTDVIGWKRVEWDGSTETPYTLLSKDGSEMQSVGGLMEMKEPDFNSAIPNNITGYIGVDDIGAVVEDVKKFGGSVHHGPFEIKDVGQIAVIEDPQGIFFCIMQSAQPYELNNDSGHGDFSWHELGTSDLEGAFSFYSNVFGWTLNQDMDEGDGSVYRLFGKEGLENSIGGMYQQKDDIPGPGGWLYYIKVDDLASAMAKVKEGGGELLMEPIEVPGGEYIVHCRGAEGTMFALHSAKGV